MTFEITDNSQVPSAEAQLQFLNGIQYILQNGKVTTTYKFALLISLVRISIEKGSDIQHNTTISLSEIAEKFIEIYWPQIKPIPLEKEENSNFTLNQHNSSKLQAKVITLLEDLAPKPKTLAELQANTEQWETLKHHIIEVLDNPIRRLQTINKESFEIIYPLKEYKKKQIRLYPTAFYSLKQFSTIIEELCQKKWIDTLQGFSKNMPILQGLPNLEAFLFQSNRIPLTKTVPILKEIQDNLCFYCGKKLNDQPEVDHFIPWSTYQYDMGHNFVLADKSCNSAKSNILATQNFHEKWLLRNIEYDDFLTMEMSKLGFLSNAERSKNIADWAYSQAKINNAPYWEPS